MQKLLSLFLAAAIGLSGLFCPAAAVTYEPDFDILSEAVYLENLDTGTVIYEKNADRRMYPASLTKIMTAVLVLENVQDLDGETAEYPMVIQNLLYGTNASLGGLIVGEQLSIRKLLYSALVQSANESAMILAAHVGNAGDVVSSITAFVEMMNDKARALGMNSTHFVNPTGLHDDDHYTTARDLSILAKYAMQNEVFAEIVSTYAIDIGPTNKHTTLWQYATNRMLIPSSTYYYSPIIGIKTGSTDEGGHCLISQTAADGYRYFCVMLGSPETKTETYVNFTETRQLYRWAYNNFSLVTLLEQGELTDEVPVRYSSDGRSVKLITGENSICLLNDEVSLSSIRYEAEIPAYVEAPVHTGDTIGTLHIKLMDEEIGTVPLVADSDMTLSWPRKVLGFIGSLFTSTAFKIILAVLILLVGGYIWLAFRHNRRRRKKRYNNRKY